MPVVDLPKRGVVQSEWTADKDVYLDKDGAVVEYGLKAVTKLVSAGGTIPMARATELGLVKDEAKPEAEASAETSSKSPADEPDVSAEKPEGKGASEKAAKHEPDAKKPKAK